MKISRTARRAHDEALAALLARGVGGVDRDEFLLSFQPGALGDVGRDGAFFTPPGLASDLAVEVPTPSASSSRPMRLLDACAGVGTLALAVVGHLDRGGREAPAGYELTMVERSEQFAEVGRRLLPWARWVVGDVLEEGLLAHLGPFDWAVSNPPYGLSVRSPWLLSRRSHFAVAEAVSRVAAGATLLLPQQCLPFRYSGRRRYEEVDPSAVDPGYAAWCRATGWEMTPSSIDTSLYSGEWRMASPVVEVVVAGPREE